MGGGKKVVSILSERSVFGAENRFFAGFLRLVVVKTTVIWYNAVLLYLFPCGDNEGVI